MERRKGRERGMQEGGGGGRENGYKEERGSEGATKTKANSITHECDSPGRRSIGSYYARLVIMILPIHRHGENI